MADAGFIVSVISAFRSDVYQSLLLAARYLDGALSDTQGRLTCLPASHSDHCRIDGAIDIANSEELVVFLAQYAGTLPFSLFRPYLADQSVAFEPWHWRMVKSLSDGDDTEYVVPRRSRKRHCAAIGRLLHGQSSLASVDSDVNSWGSPSSHVFVQELDTEKRVCVGSAQESIDLSIADADLAVGSPNTRLVTIPWGYTPLLDGAIAEADVGATVLRMVHNKSPGVTYLTPFAALADGTITAEGIRQTLIQKAALPTGDEFRLEKSRVDEWLIWGKDHVLPAEYGGSRSGYWRRAETPIRLAAQFDRWLWRSSDCNLPPYLTSATARLLEPGFSLVHFAMLLAYLQEFHSKADEFAWLRRALSKTLSNALNPTSCDASDGERTRALVFLTRAHLLSEHSRGTGLQLISANQQALSSALLACRNDVTDPFFVGHFASNLTLIKLTADHAATSSVQKWLPLLPKAATCLAWIKSSKLFYLAAAQVVSCHVLYGTDVEAISARRDLMAEILEHPCGQGIGEQGSFEGLECFHSALPIEALKALTECQTRECPSELALCRNRSLQAASFLLRLQVDDSVSLISPGQQTREGCITYSLIDKHSRLDYGIHAARAARFAENNS